MRVRKWLVVSGVVCTVVGIGASAPVAMATDKYVCEVSGTAAVNPADQGLVRDAQDLALLDVSQPGTYQLASGAIEEGFTAPSVCAEDSPPGPGQAQVAINSTGSSSGALCASDTWSGSSSISSAFQSGLHWDPPTGISLQLSFTGGVGTISGTMSNSHGTGVLSGYAVIRPDFTGGGGDCLLNDTNRYRFATAFTVTIG